MDNIYNSIIEALIFSSDELLSGNDIIKAIKGIDGEDVELNAGEILTIKPNVKHGTVTPPDITSVAISIFTPVSEKIVIEK